MAFAVVPDGDITPQTSDDYLLIYKALVDSVSDRYPHTGYPFKDIQATS
jgi:hypothetical protein